MSIETQLWALKPRKPRVIPKHPKPKTERLSKAEQNVTRRMKKVGK